MKAGASWSVSVRLGVVWRDDVIPHGTRPLDYLRRLAGVERVIIAHGNYLDDEELDFVAARLQPGSR